MQDRDGDGPAGRPDLSALRQFLKDGIRKEVDFGRTDQARGVPAPPIEKPWPPESIRIDLPGPGQWTIPPKNLEEAIRDRKSRRTFTRAPLALEELAFLLWATQGIRGPVKEKYAFRTVPSAGCRHALETYLAVLNVQGLDSGLYRYLPLTHQLRVEYAAADLPDRLVAATLGQAFCGTAAVVFAWTALPYRMEWRYGPASHKVIALDAGHVCQNLYLACGAIGAGTCAVAAYDQDGMDRLLRVDGQEEFTIYLAPVGKVGDSSARTAL